MDGKEETGQTAAEAEEEEEEEERSAETEREWRGETRLSMVAVTLTSTWLRASHVEVDRVGERADEK